MTNTLLNDKYEALKNFLVEQNEATYEELTENVDAVYNDNWHTFEIVGNEYKVLTEEEADAEAEDYIKDSLWAFNADFILDHANISTTECAYNDIVEAFRMMQTRLCENANALVEALINDIDQFVYDAIETDGRGHFISSWDGEEHEVENFYIYRTN